MMDKKQQAVSYLLEHPNAITRSSGKLISGRYGGGFFKGETPQFIQECKDEARNKVAKPAVQRFVTNKALSPKELDELVHADNISVKRGMTWCKQNKNATQWTYSISTTPISNDLLEENTFLMQFESFLDDYIPRPSMYQKANVDFKKKEGLLVFPKQDAHFDKHDIGGNNNIFRRFIEIENKTNEIITEASLFTRLEEVIYIVGSDQFNSEWTGATTKGTAQVNTHQFKESFELICNHEITIIDNLRNNSDKVTIKFIPGNHDRYVGISLILWLKAYYRNDETVVIEDSIECSKTHRFYSTGILFNHGDEQKPKELLTRFPMLFKKEWSLCDDFFVFTGDKHIEKSIAIDGINFYQVPQMSNAKGEWDDKRGFIIKGEMQAFLFKKDEGMTNIYKRKLK